MRGYLEAENLRSTQSYFLCMRLDIQRRCINYLLQMQKAILVCVDFQNLGIKAGKILTYADITTRNKTRFSV